MNALGDRCRSVLMLIAPTQEAGAFVDEAAMLHGYSACCRWRYGTEEGAMDGLKRHVNVFCSANNIAPTTWSLTNLLAAHAEAAASHRATASLLASPLTILHCSPADVNDARAAIFFTASATDSVVDDDAPYALLAVMNLACLYVDEDAHKLDASVERIAPQLAWLRPPPSFISEERQMKTNVPSNTMDRAAAALMHLYSTHPVVRDRGVLHMLELLRGEAVTTNSAVSSAEMMNAVAAQNSCSVEAVLRELTFKAGNLAKYGA